MALFMLPIGDWSNDGHCCTAWFVVDSPQDVQAWREAYFEGAAKWPDLTPDRLEGDIWSQPKELLERARDVLGYDVEAALEKGRFRPSRKKGPRTGGKRAAPENPHLDHPYARGPSRVWAEYVLAFCLAARPTLEGTILTLPMLPFYGQDKWDRHIDFIGYGQW